MANPNYYDYWYLITISCVVLLIAQIGAGEDAGSLLGGKKFIIGVPKKCGFTQFVDVELINSGNKSEVKNVTGYTIDVFNAAIDYLHLQNISVEFEYGAFVAEDGNCTEDYNGLIDQIYNGKYDAVVGDVTITANRSNYVDFTLPYAWSEVKMLVKVRHDPRMNMWIFVRPFSWDLWLSIVIVSIFVGAIILVMERNVKEDSDENSSGKQLSGASILWLPVVQAVFPERESLTRNWSRFVLVMWLIVAFVLKQSYTACLSSILTVHQLQPRYLSEYEVREDPKINIGYSGGSFIRGILVDSLKFESSRVKNYSTIEQYKEALDKGSRLGGVDAIVDEAPYIKVFLKQYGSNYAVVGTKHRIGGLGFAFPKGSPLTSNFSRAILNTSNSKEMDHIKEKYFGSSDDEGQGLSYSSSNDVSPSLTTYSFAGLFMVIGILSMLALLVSESHIWRKPVILAKTYSHQFLSRISTSTSPSGQGSITGGNVDDEGLTTTENNQNIGSEDGADNHGKISTPSLSCLDIEALPL